MKLTVEQQLLVEKNQTLIYWYSELKELDIDEWYGILAIELCVAVMEYDENKGSLSNFFKQLCDNRVWKERRKLATGKRGWGDSVPIDEYHEIIPDSTTSIDEVNLDWVDEETKGIIELRLEGHTQTEIADILDLTQPKVSRLLNKFKKELLALDR